MAIQFTDFSSKPLLDSPAKTIFEDVLKGYKMGQEPAKMKQESTQRELANQMKKLEVEHKPKEFELDDKGKAYANALKAKAMEHYDEKYNLDKQYKQAQINKLNNKSPTSVVKPNGKVANIAWVKDQLKDPNIDPEYANQLKQALVDEQEHLETTTARGKKLNDTQYKRDATPVTKAYDEIQSIQNGKFPGTDRPITPEQQSKMQSSLMLDIVKKTTDPKTREKLINANNMNITLDSIDPKKLTYYSGIEGQFVDKPADAILEGFGEGSQEYKDYIHEINKANFAAKQMRQYLGDSIQPSAQAKLDKLTKPEAWNVSPKTAEENFNFMRDLYKQESQTLVRAATDPTLYESIGVNNNPTKNSAFTIPAPKIPNTVRSKADFQAWLKTLTPAQRNALKAKHAGGQ
jgi:hypothetical protein